MRDALQEAGGEARSRTASPAADRLERWEGRSASELARLWSLPSVHLFRSLSSTSDVARELAASGAAAATAVIAEEQVAGRGRSGRRWSSSSGLGLWCSIVARPPPPEAGATLPLRVGLALAEALDPWAHGPSVLVKWPNDLILHGRKLAGILCEAVWRGGVPDHHIVGIGLNLLHASDDFPEEIRSEATSLARETGREIDRLAVAIAIFARVRPLVLGDTGALASLPDDFARRDALLGLPVQVLDPAGIPQARGTAAGIDATGSLLLQQPGGGLRRIVAGTVRLDPQEER